MVAIGRGGTITVDAIFTDPLRQPVAAENVRVEVLDPDDVQVIAPTIPDRNPAVGLYEHDVAIAGDASLGVWTVNWTGTISGVSVSAADTFTVVEAGQIQFSPAATTPLADVADLLVLVGGDPEDAAVVLQAELALRMASAKVRSEARQTFTRVDDDVARLRGNWSPMLPLPERPVRDVTTVAVDDLSLTGWTLEAGDRLTFRRVNFLPEAFWRRNLTGWGGPDCTVTVTYSHGYDVVPDDVAAVTLMLAARQHVNPSGVAREQIDDYAVTFAAGRVLPGELLDGEKHMLRRYRPHPA